MHPLYRKITDEELKFHATRSEEYGGVEAIERWGAGFFVMRLVNKVHLLEKLLHEIAPGSTLGPRTVSSHTTVIDTATITLRRELLDVAIMAKLAIINLERGFPLIRIGDRIDEGEE